ncbi:MULTISPECIES: hypothetical protein [unclassified Sphingobium]|uniref:hypothetical protein n=1 Tax=unclassified Sphingobium TaxID=2611147 RepID=UPI0035A6235B
MKRIISCFCLIAGLAIAAPAVAQSVTLPTATDRFGNVVGASGTVLLNQDGTAATTTAVTQSGPWSVNIGTGGIFNTTPPTLANGTRGDLQLDSAGSLNARLRTSVSTGTDGFVNTRIGTILGDAAGTTTGLILGSAPFVFNGTSWDRTRGDTTGLYVVGKGTGTIATGQVSVGTSSTLVAASRSGRGKIMLSVGAANTCAFGNTGVTTSTGFPLPATVGASLTLDTGAAIYAACSATTTVSFIEQY